MGRIKRERSASAIRLPTWRLELLGQPLERRLEVLAGLEASACQGTCQVDTEAAGAGRA